MHTLNDRTVTRINDGEKLVTGLTVASCELDGTAHASVSKYQR